MTVTVDIWTDINCPFCYLGKARFEAALRVFEHREEVKVVHRSFELDPTLSPGTSGPVEAHIANKYGITLEQVQANERGIAEQVEAFGLPYLTSGRDFGSSFDMHRLLHFARELGRQDELLDAFYAGNFAESAPVFGSHDRLVDIAVRAGFEEQKIRAVLADPDAYAEAVRHDEQEAASLGVNGVPFFVFAGKYAVSGAQPPEVFGRELELAWGERLVTVGAEDAETCGPDGCEIPTDRA